MQSFPNQYSAPPAGPYDTRPGPPILNNNQDNYRPAPSGLSNGNGNGNGIPHHQGNGAHYPLMPPMPPMAPMPSQTNGIPSPHYYSNPPPSSGPPPHEPVQGHFYGQGPPVAGQPEGTRGAELAPLAPGAQPKSDEPQGHSMVLEGRRYQLFVVQQPMRARMCGFGDKDRRPITPPPCVKLVITDVATGKEVDSNDVDHSMFIINADLWHENGKDEVNMVRHHNTSPSISNGTPVSYQEMGLPPAFSNNLPQSGGFKTEPGQGGATPSSYNPYPGGPQVAYSGSQSGSQSYYQNGYPSATNGSHFSSQNGYSQPSGQSNYYPTSTNSNQIDYPPQGQQVSSNQYGPARSYSQSEMSATRSPVNNSAPTGMFTRNLIGSLTTNAAKLIDPNEKIGIWFVMQDMSIRTEGNFRLRFSFVNVGIPASPTPGSTMVPTKTSAPVLAICFSKVFQVFSAKRFPGVVESTALSKMFATQGIKIPIRKDVAGKRPKRAYTPDEEEEEED